MELGEETKARQLYALYKRLGRMDYDAATSSVSALPVHTTHLHACVVSSGGQCLCHRGRQTWCHVHELGVSGSMLCTECRGDPLALQHAMWRSSAALRTAPRSRSSWSKRRSRQRPRKSTPSPTCWAARRCRVRATRTRPVASPLAPRRQECIGQQAAALACGEREMLCMPIVGRAVRLWNEWYALCSLCGAMLRVTPQHRYGAEICCLKCDAQMLGIPDRRRPSASRSPSLLAQWIRNDGSRAGKQSGSLGLVGRQCQHPIRDAQRRILPKALAVVVGRCTQSRLTRIILSHIAHNAKPIYSTGPNAVRSAAELGFEAPVKGRKRRRGKGAKAADMEPEDA